MRREPPVGKTRAAGRPERSSRTHLRATRPRPPGPAVLGSACSYPVTGVWKAVTVDSPQEEAVFGRWLRRRRQALDLTQVALARRVGCSPDTIRKVEAGLRHPSRKTAGVLARALGVPNGEREAFVRFARAGWADNPPGAGFVVAERPWLVHDEGLTPGRSPVAEPTSRRPRRAGPRTEDAEATVRGDRTARPRSTVVAREPELARLSEALEQALTGDGRVILVAGEAGQGKTTLMRAFAERAQATTPELLVAGGACNAYTGSGDPFHPFREILAQLTGDVPSGDLRDGFEREQARRLARSLPGIWGALLEAAPVLIGTLLPGPPLLRRLARSRRVPSPPTWVVTRVMRAGAHEGVVGGSHGAFVAAITALIEALALDAPLLLMLDDLQWVDRSSADVLLHLARSLASHAVLVVGAFRSSDVIGADGEPRHVVQRVRREVEQRFREAVIDLDGTDGHAFLEAWLDSQPNTLGAGFREALWRQTGGHPLFTVELLRAMQERGELVREHDRGWTLTREVTWEALPDRIAGVLGERIDRLDPLARDILRVASVEGEGFTLEVAAHVLGREPRAVARAAGEELHRGRHLIVPVLNRRGAAGPVSRYRFRHSLIQRFVYQGIDRAERRYLHEAVAEALEAGLGGSVGEDVAPLALALHFTEAQAPVRAAVHFREAGDRAFGTGAQSEAVAHYRRALESWPEERPRERGLLLQSLGESLFNTGDVSSGIHTMREARSAFEATGDVGRASQAQAHVGLALGIEGFWHRAREACREALRMVHDAPETPALAVALSALAFMQAAAFDLDDALHLGERALGVASRVDAPEAMVGALHSTGYALALSDRARREEGLHRLRQSARVAGELGLTPYVATARERLATCLLATGRVADARAELEGTLAYVRVHTLKMYESEPAVDLWYLQWRGGRWREATDQRRALDDLMRESGPASFGQRRAALRLAAADLDLGRTATARAVLLEDGRSVERLSEPPHRLAFLRERLRLAIAARSVVDADAQAAELLALVCGMRAPYYQVIDPVLTACRWLAQRPSEQAPRPETTCLDVLEEAERLYGSPEAGAALLEARAAVAAARGRTERAAAAALGAADGWRTAGMPLAEARTRSAAAHALQRAGRHPDAEIQLASARRLLEALAAGLPAGPLRASFARVRTAILEGTHFVA